MSDDALAARPHSLNPFGADERPAGGALAAAEQTRAVTEVQAALLMARMQPRDPRRAMDLILRDCLRPTLAEKATYQYARGGTAIQGPSIRLAEVIAKRWGNLWCGIRELSRQHHVSECEAWAWDLETNTRDVRGFSVPHWRDRKEGGGYFVTDARDIYEVVANAGQRRKRSAILALIDGDVIEAAVAQCEQTQAASLDMDDAFIPRMLARFAGVGVTQEHIEKRIQRRIASLTPAQGLELRRIFNSLADGMSTPGDWFENVGAPATTAAASGAGSRTAATKERIRRRKTAKTPQTTDPPGASPESGQETTQDGDGAGSADGSNEPAA